MPNLYNVPLQNNIQRTLANTLNAGETLTITFSTSVSAVLQASASIPGLLVIDRVDANGIATPSLTEYISFTGVSGSTVTGLVRGLAGTSDIAHSIGAIVEFVPDVTWADAINDVITTEHDADGQHKINTFSNLNAPEGFLINGKIVPSVLSNNLTVALKTLAGNDPSASDPIYVRIDGTIRTITSALSTTDNAGSNWLNMGSAELATYETDLFVYLSWNVSNNSPVIGVARIPYATRFDEFVASGVVEKGVLRGGTLTGTANSDPYVNIGRFAATLSASPYNWSVPTFDSSNLIQRPIFETRKLGYVPTTYGFAGSIGTFSANPYLGNYQIIGRQIQVYINVKITNKGSWSDAVYVKVPITPANESILQDMPVTGFFAAYSANPATSSRAFPVVASNAGIIQFLAAVDVSALTWGGVSVNDVFRINAVYNII